MMVRLTTPDRVHEVPMLLFLCFNLKSSDTYSSTNVGIDAVAIGEVEAYYFPKLLTMRTI